MADFDKAFSVSEGIAFGEEDNTVGILSGASNPSISGQAAPIGSLYLRAGTTEVYIKANTGDTDWVSLSSGGGLTPRQIMSYTALRV